MNDVSDEEEDVEDVLSTVEGVFAALTVTIFDTNRHSRGKQRG